MRRLSRLEDVAEWMDTKFRIPGTQIRFGLDSIAGLVPGLGDGVTALPGLYIVKEAHAMGVRKRVLTQMLWNIFIDWLIGLIPLAGDIFDVGYKSNTKNVKLIREELEAAF
ncbi:DUF4112 domain-containing protein [Minwuia sp.]|uniref:DUF4112 domain-containing protein n=1 Tax=Minwuia sp. TaxID=2493630 RepID=UPI003A9138F1